MNLDAIGIVATDMNRSIEFYKLLGLNFSDCNNTTEHSEATTKSGLRVMLDSEELMKKLKPNWKKPVGQRMTLCFSCESAKEVDSLYEKILKEGFSSQTAPWDAFWGQRYATVIDPDGNAIDLFANL